MPIKIHHGPNGSYKTSGAVWDDAVRAMHDGRVIITNIRGMSTERCRDVFPDLPESFELFNIDTDTQQGLAQARTWFHWVPRGAFIIFDEPQIIFLSKWNNSALEQFDFAGGPDAADKADRPSSFLDAWTRHRHWNWDIVLCTPNIRYIRDDIRLTSEMAYLHTNLAVLGNLIKLILRADYKEVMHSAQDNKPSLDGTIVKFKKIDKRVFKLYDSTATGQHSDTFTGQSLFKSPKLVFAFTFVALLFAYMYQSTGFNLATNGFSGTSKSSSNTPAPKVDSQVSKEVTSSPPAVGFNPNYLSLDNGSPVLDAYRQSGPFDDLKISISASLHHSYAEKSRTGDTDSQLRHYVYRFDVEHEDGRIFALSQIDFEASGYQIRSRGQCAAEIIYIYSGKIRMVTCKGSTRSAPAAAQRAPERERAGEGALTRVGG